MQNLLKVASKVPIFCSNDTIYHAPVVENDWHSGYYFATFIRSYSSDRRYW